MGGLRGLAAEIIEQAIALRSDRLSDLGRLGDPLDQLLRLVAGQQAFPEPVDHLAVERLGERALDRRAGQGLLYCLFDDRPLEHAGDRALGRLALDRPDYRLL